MKVAFWSNTRGRSCVTSNLACISVLSTLSSSDRERIIVLENHQNILNLGNALFCHQSKQEVRENRGYQVEHGLSRLLRAMERGERLSEEAVFRYAENFLGQRLFYLPAGNGRNQEMFEYRLERDCIRTIRLLEQYGNLVLVDTAAASLASSRKILRQADMVVINLSQNRQMLDHIFRNYSAIRKKAFYLIGNYDAESELTRGAIIKEYHIPGSRLGIIPHNVKFADAVSAGKLIPFLLRNYHCEEESCNYEFMASAREAALLFQKAAEQVDRWE